MADHKSFGSQYIHRNTTVLLSNIIDALRNDNIEMYWPAFRLRLGYNSGPTLELLVQDLAVQRRVILPIHDYSIYVLLDNGVNPFTGEKVYYQYVNGRTYSRIRENDHSLHSDVLFLRDVVYAKRKG